MKLKIIFGLSWYLFSFGIAMELTEPDEDFHFEQNHFDSDAFTDFYQQTQRSLKTQAELSKLGFSEELLSEVKSQTEPNLVAEEQELPTQFNVDARSFFPKKQDHVEISISKESGNHEKPKKISDYKRYKSKESKMWFEKNNNRDFRNHRIRTQNMRFEVFGKSWEKKDDPDILLELIGHGYENSHQYEAIIQMSNKTHLNYSESASMCEKQSAILEPLKFTRDETIYSVLKKNLQRMGNFTPWDRDVFQISANKIGIDIDDPVAIVLLKNSKDTANFEHSREKIYRSESISEALSTLKEIALIDYKETDVEIIRQYLQRLYN